MTDTGNFILGAADLLSQAQHMQGIGSLMQAEAILRTGMQHYPDVLDRYGHPTFQKEMVRLLVNSRQWPKAMSLIPALDGPGGGHWHEILFARAYSKFSDAENADLWWGRVAAREPSQPEARQWQFRRRHGMAGGATLPEPFSDIANKLPAQNFEVIFDVGANVGQSCVPYAKAFPSARIFAFEPATVTFEKLRGAVRNFPNVTPFNMALGETDGSLSMQQSGDSTMNRIVPAPGGEATPAPSTGNVAAQRLDSFCREQGIGHINFLKIDTEGYDLTVLRGCGDALRNIDFIQCEASANRYNKFHNAFGDIFDFMSNNGFHLFKIYGQTFEWQAGGFPLLRRFDPVFINDALVGSLDRVPAR